mmetsp:Transcript_51516/g.90556  ORF Transcript_51516/g.90556 Transcript_51516/m.90556 type:complete len:300 (-) Transcript_51516:133-1032(-)
MLLVVHEIYIQLELGGIIAWAVHKCLEVPCWGKMLIFHLVGEELVNEPQRLNIPKFVVQACTFIHCSPSTIYHERLTSRQAHSIPSMRREGIITDLMFDSFEHLCRAFNILDLVDATMFPHPLEHPGITSTYCLRILDDCIHSSFTILIRNVPLAALQLTTARLERIKIILHIGAKPNIDDTKCLQSFPRVPALLNQSICELSPVLASADFRISGRPINIPIFAPFYKKWCSCHTITWQPQVEAITRQPESTTIRRYFQRATLVECVNARSCSWLCWKRNMLGHCWLGLLPLLGSATVV